MEQYTDQLRFNVEENHDVCLYKREEQEVEEEEKVVVSHKSLPK